MDVGSRPLVSIGVPVFNAEKGLARCLDGLLSQDYSNIEIVVSDNASTDRTSEIASAYARSDPRVKYFRADINRGARWNFNRVFELAGGQYFMWAAHDDDREPTFVSACLEALERHPDAVLCQAHTAVSIDGHDRVLYVATLDSFDGKHGLVARYSETLERFPATAVYGLYRSGAMRKTALFAEVIGTDVAFIQELSIYGTFIQVPQTLFRYCARRTWNSVDDDARVFLGVARKPWWYRPGLALLANHVSRVQRAPIGGVLKARLLGLLLAHEAHRIGVRLLVTIAGRLCPASVRDAAARIFYRRWLRNPNLDVRDEELFLHRVSKPQLGWR